jgi:hypothetical protein
MEGEHLIVQPWAVHLSFVPLVVCALGTVPLQLVVNLGLSVHQRQTRERNEERLHLQSWHLRQLVSDTGDSGRSSGAALVQDSLSKPAKRG